MGLSQQKNSNSNLSFELNKRDPYKRIVSAHSIIVIVSTNITILGKNYKTIELCMGGRELGDPGWSVRGGVDDWWKNDDDIDMRKKNKKIKTLELALKAYQISP